MKSNYDYSKTMMLKIGIGNPDNKGGCNLINTFEQVLEKIKIIDNITCGAPKIIYLVGWQYNGHDDRYPEFFEVNEHAKRADMTARESLIWLMNEAKKYNTCVSLHINLSDIYKNSKLWDEYEANDLILRKRSGELKPTGTWNGRTAYQVRFAQELKSGYFKKRIDRLFELVPLSMAGTVHIDAFFVRKGKDTSIRSEKAARREMIEYINSKGCDVTSEFIYREMQCGYRSLWGKSDTIGVIPAVWHLRLTQRECLKYPASLLAGGGFNPDINYDKKLKYLFYDNMYGEGVCDAQGWWKAFLHDFAVQTVPYFYLNAFARERVKGFADGRVAYFSGGIQTRIRDKSIARNGEILKIGETLLLPLGWRENEFLAYSEKKCEKVFPFSFKYAKIYRIEEDCLADLCRAEVNGKLTLSFEEGTAYLIKGEN